jgi:hypothetical protein
MTAAVHKAKPKPKPLPVYLVLRRMIDPATSKERAAWVAAGPSDASILSERGYKLNTKVRAVMTQPRNPKFNSLVHGLGKILAQNIDRFAGKLSHDAIKALQLESGVYCDQESTEVPGLGLLIIKRPQSIAYDSMGDDEFKGFWSQCCAYLVVNDWPTLTEDRLTEMAEFEAFGGGA